MNSHIDSILKIQTLHNNAEIAQVRKFYDTVETHCRGLKALGVESSSYGRVSVNILLRRLPDKIKFIINRKMNEVSGDDNWNLQSWTKYFEQTSILKKVCFLPSPY